MAAQWNDDFHHALHAGLTGERTGYYVDLGSIDDMSKALAHGFVYEGQYSAFRNRSYGTSARHLSGERFVIFAQNHHQVGNRRRAIA